MNLVCVLFGMFVVPLYVLMKKRTFDVFALFCFANILFFLPILGGEVYGPPNYAPAIILDEVYLSFLIVQGVILLFSMVSDYGVGGGNSNIVSIADHGGARIVFFIGIVLFSMLFNFELLSYSTKREMMDNAGMELQVSMVTCLIVSLYGAIYGGRWIKVSCFLLILFTAFVGFRSYLAVFLIALFLHRFLINGKQVFLLRPIFFVVLPVFVFMFSMIKPIYASLKSDNFMTLSEYVDRSFASMEFLRTQYIFNEVVNSGFAVGLEHFFYSLLAILPFPLEYYGFSSSRFNELYQPVLFPDVVYGMAYNPWAEGYAWLGFFGVFIYAVLFCSILFVIRFSMFKSRSRGFYVLSILIGVYVAFYVHRNSLASELALIRNVVYPGCAIFLLKSAIAHSSKLLVR